MSLEISFREIEVRDAEKKVSWYNDDEVTKHLHYEDKFTIQRTIDWLEKVSNDDTRYENVIEIIDGSHHMTVGIIGLFDIDYKNKKAGFYITIGEKNFQGKGIAKRVTKLFLEHCFKKFNLQKIYLYTDKDNVIAKKLYESVGFKEEGLLRNELLYKGDFISRYYFGILRDEFLNSLNMSGDKNGDRKHI